MKDIWGIKEEENLRSKSFNEFYGLNKKKEEEDLRSVGSVIRDMLRKKGVDIN